MSLKTDILNALVKTDILNSISERREMPSIASIYRSDESWINGLFAITGIPFADYKSNVIASEFSGNMSKIASCVTSIHDATNNTYIENKNLINNYKMIYERIKTRLMFAKNSVNELLGYSCISMDNGISNQTEASFCGKIGKFITLPFFINSATMYNGDIVLTEYSPDEIQFSNVGSLFILPFENSPSVKIKSNNTAVNYRTTVNLKTSTTLNALYIKINDTVTNVKTTFLNKGIEIYTHNSLSNEIFISINPILCDMISFDMVALNTNIDKPVSIQIDSLDIFTNLQFSRSGIFESKIKETGLTKDITKLSISFNSLGYTPDKINSMLSISPSIDSTSYNNIYKNDIIDITSFRNRYSSGFRESSLGTKTISGKDLFTLAINENDVKWDMDYRNASVIYGMNTDYLNESINSKMFNNWTATGNYYVTYLLNYYDNVFIDIGLLHCSLNGKDVTGKIKIPIGFSTIQVHQMDISFDVNLFSESSTINKNNFAYIFAGLPSYNSNGTYSTSDMKTKNFDVGSTTTIELGEPFIPLKEIVTDTYGNVYRLTLSSVPNEEGTYTIEPYTGRIRIKTVGTAKYVTVKYIAAQVNNRPAGILFNRLLTFADVNNVIEDDTLFSFVGTDKSILQAKRYIILPKIPFQLNSQILYNLKTDKLFTSVKLMLSTDNKYMTPTVDDIFISVK